jgi:aryl-alcohol dehydrogenase-like predicted oxidoreductase
VIADAVNRVAAERGAEPAQVAIAWVLEQRDQGVIVPLVGARSAEQLAVNLAAVDLKLEPGELELLDDASRPVLGFPHDFPGRAMAYGDTYRLIDGHRPRAWSQIA